MTLYARQQKRHRCIEQTFGLWGRGRGWDDLGEWWLQLQTVWVLPYIDMNPPWVYMSSQSWTPLPPPTPYHLSGSSPCTSLKHPGSCMELGLVICFKYDIIHASIPFSKIIPPSPSPTESKRLFNISVSLLLSRIYMEFRKMVMITPHARQQNRHRCKEQSFELCGRSWGWVDLRE